MKTHVSLSDFHDAFISANRQDNFSYEGRELLFNYLEEYEEAMETEIELDVVALCCEYDELSTTDILRDYDIDTIGVDEDDLAEEVVGHPRNNTLHIGTTSEGTHVFLRFNSV